MATTTREAIVAAAERVIRTHGAGRATTRLIAQESGFSEATLYKHFSGKDELVLTVLLRQNPEFVSTMAGLADRVGTADVRATLVDVATAALHFYEGAAPMGGALLAEPRLLRSFRDHLGRQGTGPHVAIDLLTAYLTAERDAGRLRPDADVEAASALLLGGCFQQAFYTHYTTTLLVIEHGDAAAERLVDALLGGLLTR